MSILGAPIGFTGHWAQRFQLSSVSGQTCKGVFLTKLALTPAAPASRLTYHFNGHDRLPRPTRGEQNHWSECGRATSVVSSDALCRPHRSFLPLAVTLWRSCTYLLMIVTLAIFGICSWVSYTYERRQTRSLAIYQFRYARRHSRLPRMCDFTPGRRPASA